MLHFIATVLICKDGLDELLLVDFAHCVSGDVVDDLHDLGDLVVGQAAAQGTTHVHGRPLLHLFVVENQHGADLVAPFAAGDGYHGSFRDFGERKQLALDFQRANFLAARFDDVGGLAALDEVHGPAGPFLSTGAYVWDDSANGDVASLEPGALAVFALDEFFGGGFGVAPVFFEDGGTAQLDLAGSFAAVGTNLLAVFNQLSGVNVHETCLDGGQWPTDAGVYTVGECEAAAERHADFGHAVALEQDVATAEGSPGRLDGSGERC